MGGEIAIGIIAICMTISISVVGGIWALLTFLRSELKSIYDKIDDINKIISKVERDYVDKQNCRQYREECPTKANLRRAEKMLEAKV